MTNALKAATLMAISMKPRPTTLRAAPTSVEENIFEREIQNSKTGAISVKISVGDWPAEVSSTK
jgi:hypothetical protein